MDEQRWASLRWDLAGVGAIGLALGWSNVLVPAYLLLLGGSTALVGVVTALPPLIDGATQMLGSSLLYRVQRMQPLVVAAVTLASVLFLAMTVAPAFGPSAPLVFVGLFLLHQVLASLLAPAYMAMLGQWLQGTDPARFLGWRNSAVQGGLMLSSLTATRLLTAWGGDAYRRLWWLRSGAIAVYVFSLTRQRELRVERRPAAGLAGSLRAYYSIPTFRVLTPPLLAWIALSGLQLPLGPVLILRDLGLPASVFTIMATAGAVTQLGCQWLWARWLERVGPRGAMLLPTALGLAGTVLWLLVREQRLLIVIAVIGNVAGAGFGLAQQTLVLRLATSEQRAACFACLAALNGGVVGGFGLLGGLLGQWLAPRTLFAVSLAGLLVTWVWLWWRLPGKAAAQD